MHSLGSDPMTFALLSGYKNSIMALFYAVVSTAHFLILNVF